MISSMFSFFLYVCCLTRRWAPVQTGAAAPLQYAGHIRPHGVQRSITAACCESHWRKRDTFPAGRIVVTEMCSYQKYAIKCDRSGSLTLEMKSQQWPLPEGSFSFVMHILQNYIIQNYFFCSASHHYLNRKRVMSCGTLASCLSGNNSLLSVSSTSMIKVSVILLSVFLLSKLFVFQTYDFLFIIIVFPSGCLRFQYFSRSWPLT